MKQTTKTKLRAQASWLLSAIGYLSIAVVIATMFLTSATFTNKEFAVLLPDPSAVGQMFIKYGCAFLFSAVAFYLVRDDEVNKYK